MAKKREGGEPYPIAGAGRASSRLVDPTPPWVTPALQSFYPDVDQHDAAIVLQAVRYAVVGFFGSGIYKTSYYSSLDTACAVAPQAEQLDRGVMIYALDARDRRVLMATYDRKAGLKKVWPPKSKDEIAAEKAARKARWSR